jgi:hypothetical protein
MNAAYAKNRVKAQTHFTRFGLLLKVKRQNIKCRHRKAVKH